MAACPLHGAGMMSLDEDFMDKRAALAARRVRIEAGRMGRSRHARA